MKSRKLKDQISVLDFGAVPDGKTDCTEAIQNALNAPFDVKFPPGIYLMKKTASIKKPK